MDIIRTPVDKENIANMKQLYKFLCHMLKMNIPETISRKFTNLGLDIAFLDKKEED